MSYTPRNPLNPYEVHRVHEVEGGNSLDVTALDGAPRLQFILRDVRGNGARTIAGRVMTVTADYRGVEALHGALGAWLLDTILTGRAPK